LNSILRAEAAWKALSEIPYQFPADKWLEFRPEVEDYLRELKEAVERDRISKIVAVMHGRIMREHGAIPELMVMLDTYPHRHQIAFVWNESYRGKPRYRGARWWLRTILSMKVEDWKLPEEGTEELQPLPAPEEEAAAQ
jgi:hypothetical protein